MKTSRILSILVVAIIALTTITDASARRKDRNALWDSNMNYEVTTVGVGADGTKAVKVWGFAKKVDDAIIVAKKNAVAACIFRGLPASGMTPATPALCSDPNAATTHKAYFDKFFESGADYINYVNLTTDQAPSGTDRLKASKGYKVAIYAQVMYDNLRKKLQADGIIRSLNSGF